MVSLIVTVVVECTVWTVLLVVAEDDGADSKADVSTDVAI